MERTRVKVCGITRREDAEAVLSAGADALGFVFYAGSSRYMEAAAAREIAWGLPPFLTVVGLFVNASLAEIKQVVDMGFLQSVQLHGDETPEFCRQLRAELGGVSLIKAVRVARREDLHSLDRWPVQAILLDAKVDNRYGGTGERFDWSLLEGSSRMGGVPIILAGGLTGENVRQAVRQVNPYAVDLSSGVEQSPGIKSRSKIIQFMQQLRVADRERLAAPGWKGDGDDQAGQ
ncbi:MAG: phosphoribosylanthranilate isomerase [Magnetococcus sp. XQGC-1]